MPEPRYFLTDKGRKAIAGCERPYMDILDEEIIKALEKYKKEEAKTE